MDGDRRGDSPFQELPPEGLPEGLPEDLAPAVLAAIGSGRKIEAIKLVRSATGLGLREARTLVEALEAQYGNDAGTPPAPGFSEEGGAKSLIVIVVALFAGYLLYRYLTGG